MSECDVTTSDITITCTDTPISGRNGSLSVHSQNLILCGSITGRGSEPLSAHCHGQLKVYYNNCTVDPVLKIVLYIFPLW